MDKLSPQQITLLATMLANTLSCGLTVDEMNLLGNVLMLAGQVLTTIASAEPSEDTGEVLPR